jgi:hypothetical protein
MVDLSIVMLNYQRVTGRINVYVSSVTSLSLGRSNFQIATKNCGHSVAMITCEMISFPKINDPKGHVESQLSMDWFKGKFTGNHGFYH